jgi:hypothetical protein
MLPDASLPSLLSLSVKQRHGAGAGAVRLPLSSLYLYCISNRYLQQLIHGMNHPILHPPYSIFLMLIPAAPPAHEPGPST